MATLDVELHVTGPFQENTFILKCPATRRFAVVDPGLGIDSRCEELIADGFTFERILLTHAHLDHVWGLPAVARLADVPIHLHRDDQEMLGAVPMQAKMFGIVDVEAMPEITDENWIRTGDKIPVGASELYVFHTPGHSPGHVCFYWGDAEPSMPDESDEAELTVANPDAEGHCLVGDIVICGSVGRTDLPGGHLPTLMHSIYDRLFHLPARTVIYPGHCDISSIAAEQESNSVVGRHVRRQY